MYTLNSGVQGIWRKNALGSPHVLRLVGVQRLGAVLARIGLEKHRHTLQELFFNVEHQLAARLVLVALHDERALIHAVSRAVLLVDALQKARCNHA